MRRLSALLLALTLSPGGLARSVGEIGGGFGAEDPWVFQGWGSFKSIAAFQQLRQQNLFAASQSPFTEQRLRVGGALSKDWFRFEFAAETYAMAQPPNPTIVPLPNFRPRQALDLTAEIYTSDSVLLTTYLDRAYAQGTFGDTEIRVGRQVIAMGVGKIYSAVSQVPRHPFIIVDSEYPVTEDALAVEYNGPILFQARFLPKIEGQRGHNFHARIGERSDDYDLVLTVGRSDDKYFLGFEAAKNALGCVFRGEMVAYEMPEESTVVQAMMGVDRAFTEEFSAMLEFFYNGFGVSDPTRYSILSEVHRSSPYKGKLYLGSRAAVQFTPLLSASLGGSLNLNDGSTLFHLSATYSISDNLELMAGQYFSVSPDPLAEYGGSIPLGFGLQTGLPDLTYVMLKYHF